MVPVDSENTTTAPGESPGALYIPTDVAPEQLFQAIGRLRIEAQDEIERLLSFLDELDGDTDLEPSLGYQPGGSDDREAECEDEGADGADDREPNVDDEDDAGEPLHGWNDEEAARGRYPSIMDSRAK